MGKQDLEISYMMEKSFSLLFGDNRKDVKTFQEVLYFGVTTNSKVYKYPPALVHKNISFLLNLYNTLKIVCERLLPEYVTPIKHQTIYQKTEKHSYDLDIDWEQTIEEWASGNQTYIYLEHEVLPDTDAINLINLLLLELITHSKLFIQSIATPEIYSKSIKNIILGCENYVELICKFKENHLEKFININEKKYSQEIEKHFLKAITLESKSWGTELFSDYRKNVELLINKINNPLALLFHHIRNHYLECKIWIYQEIGLRLEQLHNKNKLFEFFCFIEFIEALKKTNRPEIIQKSFLMSSTHQEILRIEKKFYIYFDDRKNCFTKTSLNPFLSFQIPAIKNIYVEWMIVNQVNFNNSIIIDTKHGNWNSREILKVIGYLTCYGISFGIIIFRNDIKKNEFNGAILSNNVIRIDLPHEKKLYVVTIKPSKKFESINSVTMQLLIEDLNLNNVF